MTAVNIPDSIFIPAYASVFAVFGIIAAITWRKKDKKAIVVKIIAIVICSLMLLHVFASVFLTGLLMIFVKWLL